MLMACSTHSKLLYVHRSCIVAPSKPVPVDKYWMLEIYQGQLHTLQLLYCSIVWDLQDA